MLHQNSHRRRYGGPSQFPFRAESLRIVTSGRPNTSNNLSQRGGTGSSRRNLLDRAVLVENGERRSSVQLICQLNVQREG